jgi:signal transduction histidine kinase
MAQESGMHSPVAQKAKTIVEAASDYIRTHSKDMVAVQNAIRSDPRFSDPENALYVFMHCYDVARKEAIVCAHGIRPELIGKNMWHLRTPNGRLLFHEIARMVEKNGGGWIEYDWLNPFSNRLQTKISYVKGVVHRRWPQGLDWLRIMEIKVTGGMPVCP